jgi:hypothetical protein
MGSLVRAYFMFLGPDNVWEVTVHRSLEDAISRWSNLYRELPSACGIFHIGFDRPKSRYYDDIVTEYPGRVILTAASKFGMPYSYRSSRYPIAFVNEEPIFLALSGWGYELKLDPSKPTGGETPVRFSANPTGRIADFIEQAPESLEALTVAGIHDEATYVNNEATLPTELRGALGLYLISPVIKRPDFDICEFARKCPPWIANRDLDTMELSVRAKNVYRKQGFKVVRDLGKLPLGSSFLSFQNYGKKCISDTREAFLAAVSKGPLGLVEEAKKDSNLIESIRTAIEDLSGRQRDIICRRMGMFDSPQTLEQIGNLYDVTRERIRQIEKKAICKLIDNYYWGDLLEEKLDKILSETVFPIAVSGIEALDSWFAGVSDNIPVFSYVVNAKLGERYSLIRIENLSYVCSFNQETWDTILSKAKSLVRSNTLNGKTETYVRSILTKQLPEDGREFAEILWRICSKNCQFVENDLGESILIGSGRGAEIRVHALLKTSDRPLHYSEIFKHLNEVDKNDFDIRRIHNAAAEIGLLFGPGTYGLEKHLPFEDETLRDISGQIVNFIENSNEDRQWHTQEFIELIDLDSEVDPDSLNKYIIDIALKKHSNLTNLGRMSWRNSSETYGNEDRVEIYDLIIDVIEAASKPLKTREIEEEVRKRRGLSRFFQVFDTDPIIRVAPGLWGLNDRDISIKRFQQPEFLERIHEQLNERGVGLHIDEVGDLTMGYQISPWALFSLCKTDPRFGTDLERHLYLKEWGSSRQKSVSRLMKEIVENAGRALSLDEIHYEVELELGRPIEQRRISFMMSNIGATYNANYGTWSMSDIEDEVEEI